MQKSLASFFTKGADKKSSAAAASPASPEGDPEVAAPKEIESPAAGKKRAPSPQPATGADGKKFKRLRKPAAAEDAAAKDMETDPSAAAAAEPAAEAAAAPPSASPLKASAAPEASAPAQAPAKPVATFSIFNKPSSSPAPKSKPKKEEPKAKGKAAAGAKAKKASEPAASAAAAAGDEGAAAAAAHDDDDDDEEDELAELESEGEDAAPAAKGKKAAGGKAKKGDKGGAGVGDKARASALAHKDYDPLSAAAIEGAKWEPGKPVPFLYLARTFEAISETTKRLEIQTLLCNCFRTVIATTPDDLLPAVYLASSAIFPAHEGTEMGIGDATLVKALSEATGSSEAIIKEKYKQEGDLGVVAMTSRSTQRVMFQPPQLTIRGVFEEFRKIARTEGQSSNERKRGFIKKMLVASRELEPGYIIRGLQGKLRVGLAQQTVLAALADAALLQEEAAAAAGGAAEPGLADRLQRAEQTLKAVFCECPSFERIVPTMLRDGVARLPETCHFVPGVPVKPMLAKPTHGIQEILDRFSDVEFTCEYKYDGERAQIHVRDDGSVRVFSRNCEDNTERYPDITSTFARHLRPGVKSAVFDCEAVAYDREAGKILPFQVLSTRSRKDVKIQDVKIQVCLFAFDCLFADNEVLLRKPLTERRDAMRKCLVETEGELMFAKAMTSRDVEELRVFLDDSIDHNTEGLIVKTLDATYEPSKRSLNWLKLKKDYLEGVGDSLDLVPIGAFHGRGKRTGVFGAFLLACWNPDGEEYQSVCKIGTGFSEEALETLSASLRETVIPGSKKYYKFGDSLKPDVWFDTTQVWEVKCADLSISPAHQAAVGLVDANKGIALRFPRFLRVREDKQPEDATTAEQVAEFYKSQKINHTVAKGSKDDEEDY